MRWSDEMADLKTNLVFKRQKYETKTYALGERKIEGFIDNLDALKQSICKVLSTERYEYPIYSFSYGIAWSELIGNERAYIRAEMKRMIKDVLERDKRIIDVSDFKIIFSGDSCLCAFKVLSVFGELRIEKEVTI